MSIYSCNDLISGVIADNTIGFRYQKKYLSITSPLYSFKKVTLNKSEVEFLVDIKISLENIEKQFPDDESFDESLENIIDTIFQYKKTSQNTALKSFLQDIYADLSIVLGRNSNSQKQNTPKKLTPEQIQIRDLYNGLIASRLLFRPLNQATMHTIGDSKGQCYGFTMAMADSLLSPYKDNSIREVKLNRDIYEYQKRQLNRVADQIKIKKTRLTRRLFCPSFKSQAEQIYSIAEQNRQKDLKVTLENVEGMHAVYLHLQEDGKIRYADPNHGIFLFDNKAQFIAAYRILHLQESQLGYGRFKFYQVTQLHEDKTNTLKDSRTFRGKWISFLTGVKYCDHHNLAKLRKGIGLFTASLMIATITVLLTVGGTIGTVIPVIGIILGLILLIYAYVNPSLSAKGVLWGYHCARSAFDDIKNRSGDENVSDIHLDIPTDRIDSNSCK